jgi:hypothetical protein
MTCTLKGLKKEFKKYKNTLVIHMFRVMLFIDIVDMDDDFYYKFFHMDNNTVTYLSCSGGFTPLIDRLTKREYNNLASWWNCNNQDHQAGLRL